MPDILDAISQGSAALAEFAASHSAALILFLAVAAGSGLGAWSGARAILAIDERKWKRDVLSAANVSIAAMVALLGKLIQFKKDFSAPAQAAAGSIKEMLSSPRGEKERVGVHLDLWAETPFDLRLPSDRLLACAEGDLALIQVVKMLDYNLADLIHLVRERNAGIRQMNTYQALNGSLPVDGLRLYLRQTADIARNVDENLLFLDRAIGAARSAAKSLLPSRMHGAIADVGLKPEAGALMPPKDPVKDPGK